jgi:hypothetical protein
MRAFEVQLVAAKGAQLFNDLTCINCHAISETDDAVSQRWEEEN